MLDRRSLLATTAVAGIGAWTQRAHDLLAAEVSPNGRPRGAFIGCGGIASHLLDRFLELNRCDVLAVCDVDTSRREEFAGRIEKQTRKRPDSVLEFERVLDRKDIDFVVVATPDHWHAPITIAACLAGKDVYCEKPASHTVAEGDAMLAAQSKTNRIIQVGTHTRSAPHLIEARDFVRSGKLGSLAMTQSFNRGNWDRSGIGKAPDTDSPAGVDYDRWLGPAPARSFNPLRFHGTFRWFYDYANGILGDWNIHLLDIVMWTLQLEEPRSVTAVGGNYYIDDLRDTPDTVNVTYEFARADGLPPLLHHYAAVLANTPYNHNWGRGVGIEFLGSDAKVEANWDEGWKVTGEPVDFRKPDGELRVANSFRPGNRYSYGFHIANFLDCIAARTEPVASLSSHNRTCTAIHLSNIAYKVGRRLYWDSQRRRCFQDASLSIEDSAANLLLSKEYRKSYELPTIA